MFIGYINLPNIVTLAGLVLSITACFLSYNQNLEFAIVFFIFAGLSDLFDGLLARKVNINPEQKAFGEQIDSVIDIVSFGVTPVIILLNSGFNDFISLVIFSIYCICAAMRLAYFNVKKNYLIKEEAMNGYVGLPVTYTALIFPIVMTTKYFIDITIYHIIIYMVIIIISFFFIFKIHFPKVKGIFYIIFPIIALALIITWVLLYLKR